MKKFKEIFITLIGILFLTIRQGDAHEFWVEPSEFLVNVNDRVSINVYLGEPFDGELFNRDSKHFNQFKVHSAQATVPLVGMDGQSPAGYFTAQHSGMNVLVYESRPNLNQMNQLNFKQYVQEEGIDHIVDKLQVGFESGAIVSELYSRHAKSLVCVGERMRCQTWPAHPPMTLDVMPVNESYIGVDGTQKAFRVLFKGEPVAGLKVKAVHVSEPANRQEMQSSDEGRVIFDFNKPGKWMIFVVHMVPQKKNSKAQWRSYWTSLTLENLFEE